jgi:hypothetical protein
MKRADERAAAELRQRLDICQKSDTSTDEVVLEVSEGVTVVRDDRLCGGTKSRLVDLLPAQAQELVYVGNAFGGAALALSTSRKRVAFFFPQDQTPGPLLSAAQARGVVFHRSANPHRDAVAYCARSAGCFFIPNGLDVPGAQNKLRDIGNAIAANIGTQDVAFIPTASGTLVRGLQQSNLARKYVAVCVAGGVSPVGAAEVILVPEQVQEPVSERDAPPFLSTMFYDAKAWKYARDHKKSHPEQKVLFWNVL